MGPSGSLLHYILYVFMSTVVLLNEVSEALQRHYLGAILLTSMSIFATSADFEIKYFFNEDTAGVLGNT